MFYTDSHFTIGSDHIVCEDYTINGEHRGSPYIILSDGCTSANDSDFGARILCKITENHIKSTIDLLVSGSLPVVPVTETIERQILDTANSISQTLKLRSELTATLMFAFIHGGVLYTYSRGDGTIIIKRHPDAALVTTFHYEMNAPYYLKYDMYKDDRDLYMGRYGEQKLNEINQYILTPYVHSGSASTTNYPTTHVHHHTELLDDEFEYVMLSSDGIESFKPTGVEVVDKIHHRYGDIIGSLIGNIKNRKGEVAKRKINAIKNHCKSKHVTHTDDISIAMITHITTPTGSL